LDIFGIQMMILVRAIIWVTSIITVLVFVINSFLLRDHGWTIERIWHCVELSVTLSAFAAFAFEKWFWKWRIFRGRLVPFPDISGQWNGEVRSTAIDPATGTPVPMIPVTATFNQSLSHLSMVVFTPESRSDSITAKIDCSQHGRIQISALYLNVPLPQVAHNSPKHYGAVLLDIESLEGRRMSGPYWTDRKSTGELKLER
jgi:hypothetical protein